MLDNSRLVEPFDPTKDYLHGLLPFEQPDIQRKDDTKTTDEKSRRIGLKQDAMASEGAEYWSNVVKQRIEAMRLEAEIELKHSRRRKRSREIEADDYVEELKIVSARRRGAASSSRNETGQQNDRTSPQRLKNKQLITSGHTANEKYGRPIGAAADQPIATGNGGGEDNQYIKESTSLEDKTQHNVDEKDADKKLKTQLAREHNEQTVRDKPPRYNNLQTRLATTKLTPSQLELLHHLHRRREERNPNLPSSHQKPRLPRQQSPLHPRPQIPHQPLALRRHHTQ